MKHQIRWKISSFALALTLGTLLVSAFSFHALAQSPSCAAPPAGLVSWWRAESNTVDQVGGNAGTLSDNVTFGPGRVGQAFVFDGQGAAVKLGNPTNLQLQNFTIEAWIKRGSTTVASYNGNGQGLIFSYDLGGYGVFMNGSGTLALTKAGVDQVFCSTNITDTNFHHIAVSKSGSAVVFYIDGVAYPAPAYAVDFVFNTTASIGGIGNTYNFYGSVDELSIYNRPLTAAEVLGLYSAGDLGKCVAASAPVITTQPTNQIVTFGDTATFAVVAGGTAPLSYQWSANGTPLDSATNVVLTLANVQASQAGSYAVVVTNVAGGVTSAPVMLTVNPAPMCAAPPTGLVNWWKGENSGSDVVGLNNGVLRGGAPFSVGKVGTGFGFDGTSQYLELSNSSSLTPTGSFSIEAWIYPAEDRSGTILGKWGELGDWFNMRSYIFLQVPNRGLQFSITDYDRQWDGSFSVLEVQNVITLNAWNHVAAVYDYSTGTRSIYVNGLKVAERTQVPFVVNPSTANVGIGMRLAGNSVIATAFKGGIDEVGFYSRALSVSEIQAIVAAGGLGKCEVATAPTVYSQPKDQIVIVGETASFAVVAGGTAPLSYQWSVNGTALDGATNAALTLANVQASQAGSYAVVVTNVAGAVTSPPVVLTVTPAPPCVTPPAGLVSWWRAQGDALDQIGGNHGTLASGATYGLGRAGQGFEFNGSGAVVQLGNPASLRLQDFTIEAWIKRGSASFATYNGAGGHGHIFGYNTGGYTLFMDDSGYLGLSKAGYEFVLSSANITNLNFHHVAVSKNGSTVVFYIDGVAYPAPAYTPTFFFTATASIGGLGTTYSFLGAVDELGVYNRALSTAEVQGLYNAGGSGKCIVPIAPSINAQPTNRMVLLGSSATFSVGVAGTPPFSYQWCFNGAAIADATTSSYTLASVQATNVGAYSVVVSNALGTVTSSNASLALTLPPATVKMVSVANAAGGATINVPVVLVANGNENALSFSLSFDPTRLTYVEAVVGSGASGATLMVNDTQVASGRVGVLLALPADTTFAAGNQEAVQITFRTALLPYAITMPLFFGDTPTKRQLSDKQAGTLSATYTSGTVGIAAAILEGDVSPRPNGDKALMLADWVQVGRYAARLDSPANEAEFQRADCAPRSTLGDGAITIRDWVQAGRYAAGLDPLTAAGGPTTEAATPSALLKGASANNPQGAGAFARQISVANGLLLQGQSATVSVALEAQGNENALGVSLSFDPAVLTYTGASLGSGATGASLNINATQATAGKLGLALALGANKTFGAGTREMVKVSFRAATAASTNAPVSLASQPIACELSDTNALALTYNSVNGLLVVNPRPTLSIARADESLQLSWPAWGTNYLLQTLEGGVASGTTWTNMDVAPVKSSEACSVSLPLGEIVRFYRLVLP